MPAVLASQRHERAELAARMRFQGLTWAEIAADFRVRYHVNARVASRLAHGWSQREVADRWTACWPDEPKASKHISYWEQWPAPTGYEPGLRVLSKLAFLYECAVADLLADVGDYRETPKGPPRQATEGEPHRTTTALMPSGSSTGLPVESHDLDVARGVLGMFRQLDHAHGAGSFAPHLTAYMDTQLARLLVRPVVGSDVASSRSRLSAEFLELAAYQAVDSGRIGAARGLYQRAVASASKSGDTEYGGYLVGVSLAHLALHCGHPDDAYARARKAAAGLGTSASPATRAAVTAVSARALARMGRERETTAALLACERLLATASPADGPGWISYFSLAYLSDEIAHCLHDLGRAPAARPEAESALAGVGASHVRRLAIDAALLASIHLRLGDLDHACAMGTKAVGYAARTSSGRCRQRVGTLLTELSAYRHSNVMELTQLARDVLPETAVTA